MFTGFMTIVAICTALAYVLHKIANVIVDGQ